MEQSKHLYYWLYHQHVAHPSQCSWGSEEQEQDVRSLGSFVVLLLLEIHSVSPTIHGASAERFALAAKLPDLPNLLLRAMHTSWLGPGLVLAFLLLATLRRARRMAYKPLQRKVHQPRFERYRGDIPRKHQDLEI